MEVTCSYKDLGHLAGDRAHDVLALDLGADRVRRRHDRPRRTRKENLVARRQCHDSTRFNSHIPALAQDALDHGAPTYLCLDFGNGPAGGGCNRVSAGLEFAIEKVTRLLRPIAREGGL